MTDIIGILDYGVGNLHSISNSVTSLGSNSKIISNNQSFSKYSKLILPGVGAFPFAMEQIFVNKYDHEIYEFIKSGKPVLGICLGMQILARESFEIKQTKGLGVFAAEVNSLSRIVAEDKNPIIPHMGWRKIEIIKNSRLFHKSTLESEFLYFAHSFGLRSSPEILNNVTSSFDFFGTPIISSIEQGNVFGLQFHPEKSGKIGSVILQNFLDLK
jgi:glutamine amidotransferase